MNSQEEPILIRSLGDFSNCGFCTQNVLEGTGIVIKSCLHTLCQFCIEGVIEGSSTEVINCVVNEEGHQCTGTLLRTEIKALLTEESYRRYMGRIANDVASSITNSENFHKCMNGECKGGFILDESVSDFVCTMCGFHTCRICNCTTNRLPGTRCVGECDTFTTDSITPQTIVKNLRKRKIVTKAFVPAPVIKRPVVDVKNLYNQNVRQDFMSGWDQIMEKLRDLPLSSEVDENAKIVDFIERQDFIANSKEFECSICICEIPPGDGVILKDCYHLFCKICVSGIVEHSEEPKVKCPFQTNGYSCTSFIEDREIRALVSDEVFQKHIGRSLQTAELTNKNAFHCQTLNCNFWCEVEVIDGNFDCPNCNKKNCIKCKAVHENVSCEEYRSKIHDGDCDPESKIALTKMINEGKAMRCPNCRVVIIKDGGCDGVICSVCRFNICWITKGPRWGPKGLGDFSSGCRCRLDGKKCHPKCTNCH